MKKFGWIFCLLAVLSLAACGTKNDNPAENNASEAIGTTDQNTNNAEAATPTEVPKRTTVPSHTDYLTEEDMQTASPWQICDNAALAAVMKKAEAGEPVTIATIGGSITQGSISNGAKDSQIKAKSCYADIFFSWWKETFPQSEVTVVNAGIGATDSYLGVHRLKEDVLDYNPDLVLVEYSVNDGGNNTFKITYDN